MRIMNPLSMLIMRGRFPDQGKVIFSGLGHFGLRRLAHVLRVSSHTGRKLWMWPIVKGEGGPGHV